MKPAPLSTTLTSSLRPRHGGTTKLDFTTEQEIWGESQGQVFGGPKEKGQYSQFRPSNGIDGKACMREGMIGMSWEGTRGSLGNG